MAGVAELVERWIVVSWTPVNISNLAPKFIQTNCRQIEWKYVEKMKNGILNLL